MPVNGLIFMAIVAIISSNGVASQSDSSARPGNLGDFGNLMKPVMESVSKLNSGFNLTDNPIMTLVGPSLGITTQKVEVPTTTTKKPVMGVIPIHDLSKSMQGIPEVGGRLFGQLTGLTSSSPLEGDKAYYEFDYDSEPNKYREPRYFSKECRFRSACEIGRQLRKFTLPFASAMAKNSAIQDLQNRYSRAITYGMLHDDCDRYYCLLTQFISGPKNFVGGMAELVNRMANPEQYSSI